MSIDNALIFASQIGSKLHSGFLKVFTGDIEEDELIRNNPAADPELQQKNEPFLDRN